MIIKMILLCLDSNNKRMEFAHDRKLSGGIEN